MKKIPTMFERVFEGHHVKEVKNQLTSPGALYALLHGIPTVKMDGSCCAIIDGVFYRRYDAKKGKKAPEGAIPCCEADPVTGHHPHWVKVDFDNPDDKWFAEAYRNYPEKWFRNTTYEAVGPHFNGNPYKLEKDVLIQHGAQPAWEVHRSFDGIRYYLEKNPVEGLVFWVDGEPFCKIKRTDFGLPWPPRKDEWSADAVVINVLADPIGHSKKIAKIMGINPKIVEDTNGFE